MSNSASKRCYAVCWNTKKYEQISRGQTLTGVAVACLNNNMESHVLTRQSNNKRRGGQTGLVVLIHLNTSVSPLHAYFWRYAKQGSNLCPSDNSLIRLVPSYQGEFGAPSWRGIANFGPARLTLCPMYKGTRSQRSCCWCYYIYFITEQHRALDASSYVVNKH